MKELEVEFTCPDCDEVFFIKPSEILEKDQIACPKCGCSLSEDELRDIKIAVQYLNNTN